MTTDGPLRTDRPTPKHRRTRGTGSVFKIGKVYWIAYRKAGGRRVKESSGSQLKGVAVQLLDSRNGSRIHNLPVVKNAEKVTFDEAARALITDTTVHHPKSLKGLTRRITKHLAPFFGGWRLAAITSADVTVYVAQRQQQGIVAVKGPKKGQRVKDVTNAEINRSLQTLKRIFSLAIEQNFLAMRPTIKLLPESLPRSGFFEREQIDSVLKHLPAEIRPVIRFGYLTGWRVADEVLPLEWRNVDLGAGEVRLDPGTSKNKSGRLIHMSAELRQVLEAQWAEHERLKKAGVIVPQVFFREVAEGRGGEKKPKVITSFNKAWKLACRLAGCPGKIPHDLRRTAVRNFVRAGIPQSVAMELTGHKTASVFARYNITSGADLREAAVKMNKAAGR